MVAIGAVCAQPISGGNRSVFIGNECGTSALQYREPNSCIAIGWGAYTTKNFQAVIGGSDVTETILRGKILIGTEATLGATSSKLELLGDAYVSGTHTAGVLLSYGDIKGAGVALSWGDTFMRWYYDASYHMGMLSTTGSRIVTLYSTAPDGNSTVDISTGVTGSTFGTKLRVNNAGNVMIGTTTDTGGKLQVNGDIALNTAGNGLKVKSGTNARVGQATLVAGTVVVSNTSITANTRIFLTVSSAGGTQGFLRTTKVASTSFTITSTSATETSVVDWFLVESF
jgi:hypothetical protein